MLIKTIPLLLLCNGISASSTKYYGPSMSFAEFDGYVESLVMNIKVCYGSLGLSSIEFDYLND